MKTLAFTGHRPKDLGGYDENNPLAQKVKVKLKELIWQAYESGYREFVTGLAMGVDQWAGEIVAELKTIHDDVRLIGAAPFASHSGRWFPKSKRAWERLIAKCDELYIVDSSHDEPVTVEQLLTLSQIPSDEPKHIISKKMDDRNKWMVDKANSVLAVWCGTPGGTSNCVQYAKTQGKRVIKYNPDDDTVSKF